MKSHTLRSELFLLVTAIIWGFAFVSQRLGLDHMPPYLFNAVRFALGGLVLIPIAWWLNKKYAANNTSALTAATTSKPKGPGLLLAGVLLGFFLFMGASFQQVGLLYTTAGNAGFITGLYIIIVPFIGIFLGHKTQVNTWLGAILALVGLYLLSVKADFSLAYGDLLQLVGACFWAGHVLLVGWLSPKHNPVTLSVIQFFACAALSFMVALAIEPISLASIKAGWAPLAYTGLVSVGVAYTLQVIGQRNVPASHSAIILSLEAVFAVIGGYLFLAETHSLKSLLGCGLMLAGMLVSQFKFSWFNVQSRALSS